MRNSSVLAKLAAGVKFRLFRQYRDRTNRPRLRCQGVNLADHDLVVEGHQGDTTWVHIGDTGLRAPLWAGLKVLL